MIVKITGYDVLIDDEDLEKVTTIKWTVLKTKGLIYFRRNNHENNAMLLHRYIINARKGTCVDHISGDTLDNRKCNLRICTIAQNTMNSKRRSDNRSGYKGVGWVKAKRKWQAKIMVNQKTIFLGHFNTPEEAHAAYCEASEKYHGEFGRAN